jgi:class 3 adenylate cyclase
MKCSNCDFDAPAEMRFCGMCGTSLICICPACAFHNPADYQFCGMCGVRLPEAVKRTGQNRRLSLPTGQSANETITYEPAGTPAGTMATTAQNVSFSGERRVATILFTDVKNSTELLEQLGTETWVEVMNKMFQVLEGEIYRYCGEVGQFRGDGMVAYFGAKAANEDDPEHAVLAGLAIQEAIRPFADALEQKEGVRLVVRVGINTGDIIVASVGDAQHSEDTAMGEALTVAARMEASAEPGTVLVSENTYRLVREKFEWQSLGEISVKGISRAMPVFRPLKPRPGSDLDQDEDPFRGVFLSSDLETFNFSRGMIGRKTEFHALERCIEELNAGRGGIILVTGMKGMGKSFLVNQVRLHYARQEVLLAAAHTHEQDRPRMGDEKPPQASHPITWLRGRCRSYGHLRPYSMWLDLMQEWTNLHPGDQNGSVLTALRAQMEMQGSVDGVIRDVEKDYPNLATFLSAPAEESASERARFQDAEGIKRQFFRSMRDWVRQLANHGPLVIAFADMQWADTTSIELLEYCLPLCDSDPIQWILVYRLERDAPVWEFQHRMETNYPHRLTHLNIPPLSRQENEEFIDQFLGKEALRPELRALLIKKSEGNPYFIKELIHALIAQGALAPDGEGHLHQARAVTSLDLPDSLHSLLMARIDRLSASERRILQMAAVIGSIFWLNALQALAEPTVTLRQIQADLVALQRAGIIHERAVVEDLGMEYAFDSSLIREVAYESLLNPQRVAYHIRVAEFLEEIIFREGKRRHFNTLAHHYRLAGDKKKELFYTLQAAERAQSIYANAEALHYYTRAISLLAEMEAQQNTNSAQRNAIRTQLFEALNGRRAVYFLMGNVEAGWADARALLPLARQMEQDPTWLIDALLQQPGVSSAESREELMEGMPMAEEALALSQRIGDKRREMNCLLTIASQRSLINDPQWVAIGDRALALAREIGDRQYEAMILLALGHAYVGRDELQKGMDYLNAALPICQSLDDKVTEMVLLRVLGAQHERSGDHYHRLVAFEQKRLAIAREIGDRFEEGESMMFCGQIQALNLGDLENGLAQLLESEKILEAVTGRIFTLLRIAQAQIALGRFDQAKETLERAAPVADRNLYDLGRVGLKMVTILLYNALGDRTHLELALEIVQEINEMDSNQIISRQYLMAAGCEAAAAHLGLARLESDADARKQHFIEALRASKNALDLYQGFGYVNIIECACEEIYLRHSQALAANGYADEAASFLDMANNEMMRKFEMIPPEQSFRRTFLENIAYHREIRAAYTAATLVKANIIRSGNASL